MASFEQETRDACNAWLAMLHTERSLIKATIACLDMPCCTRAPGILYVSFDYGRTVHDKQPNLHGRALFTEPCWSTHWRQKWHLRDTDQAQVAIGTLWHEYISLGQQMHVCQDIVDSLDLFKPGGEAHRCLVRAYADGGMHHCFHYRPRRMASRYNIQELLTEPKEGH
jgi:hypothetical protein